MDRIVFLGTPINDDVANIIIAQLLFLEADNPGRDIFLYINSPGGSVSAGLAIYDTMQYLKSPVNTICMGMAASMGCFLLAAGERQAHGAAALAHHDSPAVGRRAGHGGRHRDQAKEILYLRGKMHELMAKHTGQARRDGRTGLRPRSIHVGGRGEGIRDHRSDHHEPRGDH